MLGLSNENIRANLSGEVTPEMQSYKLYDAVLEMSRGSVLISDEPIEVLATDEKPIGKEPFAEVQDGVIYSRSICSDEIVVHDMLIYLDRKKSQILLVSGRS